MALGRFITGPMKPPRDDRAVGLLFALGVLTAAGLGARLYASHVLGFGDSEALYACYALHPAPAYVDHPGGIGILARAIGGGTAPLPGPAHAWTSLASSAAPWLVAVAANLLGAKRRHALGAAIAVAVAPEVAVGLFGMTPDLPLYFAWVSSLALFGRGLRAAPGGRAAVACFLTSGLTLGLGCASKVSALTLALAFLVTLTRPPCREHARSLWPFVTLALAALVFAPVVRFEATTGWPMLAHRLIDTQREAGLSLRNLVAVPLGQALYITPGLLAVLLVEARALHRSNDTSTTTALLRTALVVPLACLGLLSLWSRVAEPHWLAPAWLAVPLAYAIRRSTAPDGDVPAAHSRWNVPAVALAGALSAGVYLWVLAPDAPRIVPAAAYDARADIANELYGWQDVADDVARTVEAVRPPLSEPGDVVVVGSVWMVAAQLEARLPRSVPVGCAGDSVADFSTWNPPATWQRAELVVFVHDNRMPVDGEAAFPDRTRIATRTRTLARGGHTARTFTIEVLSRRAAG